MENVFSIVKLNITTMYWIFLVFKALDCMEILINNFFLHYQCSATVSLQYVCTTKSIVLWFWDGGSTLIMIND